MDLDLLLGLADVSSTCARIHATLTSENLEIDVFGWVDKPPHDELEAVTQPTAAQIFQMLEEDPEGLTELPSTLFSPPSDLEKPPSTEASLKAWLWQLSTNNFVFFPRDTADQSHYGQPFEKVQAEERPCRIIFDAADVSQVLAGVSLSGASFGENHGGAKDSEEVPPFSFFIPDEETFLNLKWPGYNHLHLRFRFPFFHDDGTPLTYRELATRISKTFVGVLYKFCRFGYVDPKDGSGRPLGPNTITLSQIRLLSICSDDGVEWFPNFSIVYVDRPSKESE